MCRWMKALNPRRSRMHKATRKTLRRADMTAKMMGPLTPRVNRFQIGDLEVTSVLDGTVQPEAVKPPLCLDMTDEEIAALAKANHVPSHTYEHPFAPTLVNTGNELVLFDTGFG